ncbi:unnamed protein product, partial [Cylindrotheca closterium]
PHFELSSKQNGYAGLGMTAKMATVRKNKEGFTPRQVKAAMEARSAMHILNAPSTKSLKYAIQSGLIKDCPITEEAINHAKAIFGPDASTLKGKSTRPTPKKTHDDFFSPPEELYQHNRTITVCIDHMEIGDAKFLICIDTTVCYRSCIPMQNLKTEPVFEALDKIFRRYNKAGFHVKTIKCDRAFIPLTDDMLDDMGVTIDPTAAGDHKPTAERNNRTLKERVVVLPVTNQVIQRVEAWAAAKGVTSMKFFDKKRDLETFQDDQDYEPEDEDERDFNLRGQFDDIDDSKRKELLADADNDVDDMPELIVRFQGDDDYESDDDDSGDEGDEEEEPIVANLDHYQENVNRGTNDIGSLVTDLEDLQEPPEEEIVFEPGDISRWQSNCRNEDERDFNLRGQFDDIDDSKRKELLADADNDVDDMPELIVRFQGDDDYESDDNNLGDEGDEEEEPIVADLDHHQGNADRGTVTHNFENCAVLKLSDAVSKLRKLKNVHNLRSGGLTGVVILRTSGNTAYPQSLRSQM